MSLDGFPTLQALGAEFARIADAERAGLAVRRRPRRSLVLGIAIALGLAGSAAAGTLLLLRGSVIPAPQKIDVGAVQFVVPDSIRLADQRAADPDGGAPWGLQLSRSETGLVCSTVGQVVGERFGLVGLDGRFRVYEPGVVDGCGAEQENATTLLGARVFDADVPADVRTVVNGVAGPTLARVDITAGGRVTHPPIGDGGTYVAVFRGYPEDLGLDVDLRFDDGHVERHPLGVGARIVVDPLGAPAWSIEGFQVSGSPLLCTAVRQARDDGTSSPLSPAACGILRSPEPFFAIRRLRPSCRVEAVPLVDGRWCGAPARTLIWGATGSRVTRLIVTGPGIEQELRPDIAGRILAVFGPSVDPRTLRVRVTYRNGDTEVLSGDTNLRKAPRP